MPCVYMCGAELRILLFYNSRFFKGTSNTLGSDLTSKTERRNKVTVSIIFMIYFCF